MLTAILEMKVEIIKIPKMCKNQFLLIVCIVAPSLLSAGSAHTIDLSQIEDRMKGGQICDIDKSPFLVTVIKYNTANPTPKPKGLANGFIISPKFVVTVTYDTMKIPDSNTETYNIYAGCHQLLSNCSTEQRFGFLNSYYLPDDVRRQFPDLEDLILLETGGEIKFGPAVAAAKLQTEKKGFAAECRRGTVMNRVQPDGQVIKTRCAEIELTDDASKCDAEGSPLFKYQLLGVVESTMSLERSRDIGAPLVCDGYVVGIWVYNSAIKDQTLRCTTFVTVEVLYQWFNEHAKLNLPDWNIANAPYNEKWIKETTSNTPNIPNTPTTPNISNISNMTRNEKNASPTSTLNPINILIIFTVLLAIF